MHTELHEMKLASLKDFAKHYLMIVLSILTALGLEAWIEHAHHRHAAEVSRQRMDQELAEVLKDIQRSEQINQKTLASLKAFDAQIVADLASGLDTTEVSKYILAHKSEATINTNWPTLPTNAWDAAVADQSVGWIDASTLRRYAAAYTSERILSNWLLHDSILLVDAPRLVDTITDLNMDRPVEPYAVLHSLRQMEQMLSTTISFSQGTAHDIQPILDNADRL
jgi:hypothetical protein